MEKQFNQDANVFKAFCDPNRLRILDILKSGEHCACKLLDILDVSQSTLSHHMKILCDSGVVTGRKDGKWTHYSISPEGSAYAMNCLQALTQIEVKDKKMSCCGK